MKLRRFRHRSTTATPVRSLSPAPPAPPTALAARESEAAVALEPATALDWTRAREHWNRGDWTALGALAPSALRQADERARLALLAGAAQLQMGRPDEARRLILLARDWGCDKRLIRQVLVAGLHNTLGRAAALCDDPGRALAHFAASVATASPGSAGPASIQSRVREQLGQMGLSVQSPDPGVGKTPPPGARELAEPVRAELGEASSDWACITADDHGACAAWTDGPRSLRLARLGVDGQVQATCRLALRSGAPEGIGDAMVLTDGDGHFWLLRLENGVLCLRRSTDAWQLQAWSSEGTLDTPVRLWALHGPLPMSAQAAAVLWARADDGWVLLAHAGGWNGWVAKQLPPEVQSPVLARSDTDTIFVVDPAGAWVERGSRWETLPRPPWQGQPVAVLAAGCSRGVLQVLLRRRDGLMLSAWNDSTWVVSGPTEDPFGAQPVASAGQDAVFVLAGASRASAGQFRLLRVTPGEPGGGLAGARGPQAAGMACAVGSHTLLHVLTRSHPPSHRIDALTFTNLSLPADRP